MSDAIPNSGSKPPPLPPEYVTDQAPRPTPRVGKEEVSEGEAEIHVELTRASWLRRTFEVYLPEGKSYVEYYGRGMGYESVLVDGFTSRCETNTFWFVPKFNFRIGRRRATIKIKVWPWMLMRSFEFWIDNELYYSEGPRIK